MCPPLCGLWQGQQWVSLCHTIPAHSRGDAGAMAVPGVPNISIVGGIGHSTLALLQHPARSLPGPVSPCGRDPGLVRVLTTACAANRASSKVQLIEARCSLLGRLSATGRGGAPKIPALLRSCVLQGP